MVVRNTEHVDNGTDVYRIDIQRTFAREELFVGKVNLICH